MTQVSDEMKGKVAIVTGATKGMGATISEDFVARGGKVVATSRHTAENQAWAEELNQKYGKGEKVAVGATGQLDQKADQQGFVDTALSAFGKITTLVCSPTTRPWFGSAIDTPEDEIDIQYVHCFKTRFWITSMCIPHMAAAGGGSVVYIGSGSAFEATAERSVYSCMRAAEVQLMKNFAAEFGQNNIRFNIISPGLIDANGSKSLFEDAQTVKDITSGMPMRRHGSTAEISNAVMWLVSEASSFTTGAIVPVDGGRNLHAVKSRLTNAFAGEQAQRMAKSA